MLSQADLKELRKHGIVFDSALRPCYIEPEWLDEEGGFQLAMDAQPTLITTPNAGIPALFANLIDPEMVRVLVQPMKAEELFGAVKKGDWTKWSVEFPVGEATGNVTSYGDFNNDGSAGANFNWIPRQSYHFQTISQWGEREMDMYGEAKINYKSEVDIASALVINKFLNKSWFFGVNLLDNYGILNDPSLPASISPTAAWSTLDVLGVFNDIKRLVSALITSLKGIVDMESDFLLTMSPELQVYFADSSTFGVNVTDLVKKNFPNLKVKTAPEYSNANSSGELMQLTVEKIEGTDTAYCAFTEKMRVHPVLPDLSGWRQKKSAGTWGWINRRPVAMAQMQGM